MEVALGFNEASVELGVSACDTLAGNLLLPATPKIARPLAEMLNTGPLPAAADP
jgi:hypothetical protein